MVAVVVHGKTSIAFVPRLLQRPAVLPVLLLCVQILSEYPILLRPLRAQLLTLGQHPQVQLLPADRAQQAFL